MTTTSAAQQTGRPAPGTHTEDKVGIWQTLSRSGIFGVTAALLVLVIIMAIIAPYFWTANNLLEIIRQVSAIAIIAAGGTFVILTSGIDLSVGSALGLTAMVAIVLADGSSSAVVCVLAAIAVGAVVGAINGFFVARFALPAFIVTLAALTYLRGFVYVGTGGTTLVPDSVPFSWIGQGNLLGIPVAALVMVLVYIVGWVLLERTVFGRQVYAIGGNAQAARLSGIPVRRVIFLVYVIAGMCAGIAGIIVSARLESAVPVLGTGYELNAIAAIVLGGTSLMGGRGSLMGTLVGTLFIAVLSNGMTLLNVQSFYQQIIMGAVILTAVLVDRIRRRKEPQH